MMRPVTIAAAFLAAAGSTGPEPRLMGSLGGSGTDDCDGIALDREGQGVRLGDIGIEDDAAERLASPIGIRRRTVRCDGGRHRHQAATEINAAGD